MLLANAVLLFSEGIALAEGFYVNNSRAARNHNPGNLTVDLTGNGVGFDGPFVQYPNDATGWAALYEQVTRILTDTSGIYSSTMTLREIAQRYTTTDQLAWANNVASKLGIDIDTPVSTLLTTPSFAIVGLLTIAAAWWYFRKG